MQNKHNNETNFPVNATKGAQVLALVFVIGAAVFTNGDQKKRQLKFPPSFRHSRHPRFPPPPTRGAGYGGNQLPQGGDCRWRKGHLTSRGF